MLKPIYPPSDPKLKPDHVTVIIPCLDWNEKLAKTVTSIVANCPQKIILVTVEINYEKVKRRLKEINPGSTRFQVEAVRNPNKREQLAIGIELVETDLTVFADDDVYWPSRVLQWMIAPFEAMPRF